MSFPVLGRLRSAGDPACRFKRIISEPGCVDRGELLEKAGCRLAMVLTRLLQ